MKATLNTAVLCGECGLVMTQRRLEEGLAVTCATPDCKNSDPENPKYYAMPTVTLTAIKESKKDTRAREIRRQGESPDEVFQREEREEAEAKAAAEREKEMKAAAKAEKKAAPVEE